MISATVGGVATVGGQPFMVWAVAAFIAQFLIFYISNTNAKIRAAETERMAKIKEAEILAQNTIECACASCRKVSNIIINTQTDNKYKCGYCGVKNSIYLVAETAVITEPLYVKDPPRPGTDLQQPPKTT